MEVWLWILIGSLIAVVIALSVKVYILRKSAKEIEIAFADRLITDTNRLIDISSRDKNMRSLANTINGQLRKLRTERRRFYQGDQELKNAVTNISHDLRTPLTSICGYLELLEQEENSETIHRYMEIIKDRVEILTQLSEELFRYSVVMSTKDHTKRESVVLNTVLEESVAAFYTVEAARKSTGLGLSISKTLVEQMNGTISAAYEHGRLSIHIVFPENEIKI